MGFETMTGGRGGRRPGAPSLRIVIHKSTARGYLSIAALRDALRLRIEIDRQEKIIRVSPTAIKTPGSLKISRNRNGAGSFSMGRQHLTGVPLETKIYLTECADGWWYGSYS